MTEEKKLICGVKEEVIKKAFFSGKLKQLMNELQANGNINSVDDAQELKKYLEVLKLQDGFITAEIKNGFAEELGDDEIKPPSVDELTKNDTNVEQWLKDKETALGMIRAKMKIVRDKLGKSTKFDIKELQELAFELSFWTMWISQDRIYKRQLWKRKLTQLIDEYGISRKEAEDRSELTKEYRDYVLADAFKDNVDNLIISARRGYTE